MNTNDIIANKSACGRGCSILESTAVALTKSGVSQAWLLFLDEAP